MKILGRESFIAAMLAAAVSPIKAEEPDVVLEEECIPVRKSVEAYRVKLNWFVFSTLFLCFHSLTQPYQTSRPNLEGPRRSEIFPALVGEKNGF